MCIRDRLYIILFLSGIDGAWALPIEKEGMSIYSPSLKQEVSYSIILPEGYEPVSYTHLEDGLLL